MMHMTLTKVPRFAEFGKAFLSKKKDFYADAMKLIVDDMIRGILERMDVTGGSFPSLEPETILRKLHDRPLVDKGLLSDPFTYEQTNQWKNDAGTITIKPLTAPVEAARKTKAGHWTTRAKKGATRDTPRDQVGRYLQIDGTKRGKHFYFFGISKYAEADVVDLLDILIDECLGSL
jgi:hypothetical protein